MGRGYAAYQSDSDSDSDSDRRFASADSEGDDDDDDGIKEDTDHGNDSAKAPQTVKEAPGAGNVSIEGAGPTQKEDKGSDANQ